MGVEHRAVGYRVDLAYPSTGVLQFYDGRLSRGGWKRVPFRGSDVGGKWATAEVVTQKEAEVGLRVPKMERFYIAQWEQQHEKVSLVLQVTDLSYGTWRGREHGNRLRSGQRVVVVVRPYLVPRQ
jgi:hypothetical protein